MKDVDRRIAEGQERGSNRSLLKQPEPAAAQSARAMSSREVISE
jgi:hypothetical protein